jgi:hypothetical protein
MICVYKLFCPLRNEVFVREEMIAVLRLCWLFLLTILYDFIRSLRLSQLSIAAKAYSRRKKFIVHGTKPSEQ